MYFGAGGGRDHSHVSGLGNCINGSYMYSSKKSGGGLDLHRKEFNNTLNNLCPMLQIAKDQNER